MVVFRDVFGSFNLVNLIAELVFVESADHLRRGIEGVFHNVQGSREFFVVNLSYQLVMHHFVDRLLCLHGGLFSLCVDIFKFAQHLVPLLAGFLVVSHFGMHHICHRVLFH